MDWVNSPWYAMVIFLVLQTILIVFAFLKFNKKENSKIEKLDKTGDQSQMAELIKIISKSVENQEKQSQATHEIAIEFKGMATFITSDSQNHTEKLRDIKENQTGYHKRMDELYKITLPEITGKLSDIFQKIEKIDLQTTLCPNTKKE